MPLGYCPQCGAGEASRERRPNGNSTCVSGDEFPSACVIDEPTKTYTALNHVPEKLHAYARQHGGIWFVGHVPEADPRPLFLVDAETAKFSDPRISAAETVPIGAGLTTTLSLTPSKVGAIAVAVDSHMTAELLNALFARLGNPLHQGVVAIPFAASALGYAGPGSLLFSALLVIPPRDGPIARVQFDTWVDQAIAPYLSPTAPRVTL